LEFRGKPRQSWENPRIPRALSEFERTGGVLTRIEPEFQRELDFRSSSVAYIPQFVQIRGLKVLGITLRITGEYDAGTKICFKLAEAMQMLPMSSPFLDKLRLNFTMPFSSDGDFPLEAYQDLVASMNQTHFPFLTTLDLSLNLDPDDGEEWGPDDLPSDSLFPFLNSHPKVSDLTLNIPRMKLTEDLAFLPLLCSFTGTFEQAVVVCARQQRLEKLAITMIHPYPSYELPEFCALPLFANPSLTILKVSAADLLGQVVKARNELSPTSFAELVSSFPNLKHLDICINRPMVRPLNPPHVY
jgi:hypothetical protein